VTIHNSINIDNVIWWKDVNSPFTGDVQVHEFTSIVLHLDFTWWLSISSVCIKQRKISQSNNILYKLEVELILIMIFRHFSSAGSELKGLESGRGERCSPHV